MTSKILSMNIGGPKKLEWKGRSILTSIQKSPVDGPLIVLSDQIENNIFADPKYHGTLDSVLYIYGMSSANKFAQRLGLKEYTPGLTGETLTVDHFDETKISVGDVFQIGEVVAQASFPRVPCAKLIFCMQHDDGLKAMQDCGLSGVYFRILKPGKISKTDEVKRVEQAKHPFLIPEIYEIRVKNMKPTRKQYELMLANGAFPAKTVEKWSKFFPEGVE